ncbi:hypothetical protein GTU79_19670 [Sodalis ligni]|uniref:hypothetical protein n=1 Tax=Sodalis ligni TaxID=2697027 RepID=UPI001BDDEE79|nr:hypothetical protein [Sodalis ligni]QWA09560.1 hypothetical protein GTU79_19670 [Sodalis ligni]
MSKELKLMKKSDNFISAIVDSTFTIPAKMGAETFCTIHFVKHVMDLNLDDKGDFVGNVSLNKEIIASMTLTRSHAEELSSIITAQLAILDDEVAKEAHNVLNIWSYW